MSALQKRFQVLLSVLSLLLLIVLAAAGYAWWQIRGSLPQLDGEQRLAGLSAPVKIARDARGVPVITGATRADVARALGFLHAQERFFQMDLLRRSGAGELSELFGAAALDYDKAHRLHGFRRTAEKALALASPTERAVLEAYTAGVNAGLAALPKVPWEYLVVRTAPQPWRMEDSFLAIYAMWFDLQDWRGDSELNLRALRLAVGTPAMNFFAPPGNSWDAALDGSTFPAAPLPPLRLKPEDEKKSPTASLREPPSDVILGSNAFAVAGSHTANGAAILANDMHLGFSVPHIWYRAEFNWTDAGGAHRVDGVTLPGTPAMTVGSNGHVAWGFTDAYVDTTDVVIAETDSIGQIQYRTPRGWVDIEDRAEVIKVKGAAPVNFTARWTEWGPIIGGPEDGRYFVMNWTAHAPEATNFTAMELETAADTAAAIDIMHRAGIPNENALIADSAGAVAWTIIGKIPRRIGFDGRLPVSWAFGDRRWDGWLKPEEIPVVRPADGLIWSGNNRAVGGAALALVGDGGYDRGARGGQIRDDLRALAASGKKMTPADLLAVQLDDRAVFLARWQKLLLEVLTDGAVAQRPDRAALRDAVRQWAGHASPDSAAYRLVRAYRSHTAERALKPFFERGEEFYEKFSWRRFNYDDALWQLVQEKPVRLLNPAHKSWESLLLAAADDVLADADKAGLTPAKFTWGRFNTLKMQHPFGRFLPGPLARLLDMPAVPMAGDSNMPRVANPGHGASERLVVAPGHEAEAIFHMPGGQSGNPLSPYYRAGHDDWVKGAATPLLPGPAEHTLTLTPQ